MCSVNSPQTSTLAEHHDVLRQALADVGEHSFCAYVESCDPARFAEEASLVPSWVRSSVLFDGAFGGAVLLAVPDALGRDLFGAFLGAEPGLVPLDGALFDLVGELTNMVCGAWLTRACQGRFELRHPEVSRMRPDESHPDGRDCLLFLINDQPCYLRLALANR
jgi:hypothetical protein